MLLTILFFYDTGKKHRGGTAAPLFSSGLYLSPDTQPHARTVDYQFHSYEPYDSIAPPVLEAPPCQKSAPLLLASPYASAPIIGNTGITSELISNPRSTKKDTETTLGGRYIFFCDLAFIIHIIIQLIIELYKQYLHNNINAYAQYATLSNNIHIVIQNITITLTLQSTQIFLIYANIT